MASGEDEDLLALRSAAMATMKKSKDDKLNDDVELERLRKAALMTKRHHNKMTAAGRQHNQRGHKASITGVPFMGTPPFKLAKGSNLIVISTISDEEKTEDEPQPVPVVKEKEVPAIVRPQDKWLSDNSQSSVSSPQKAKVQDKFSRYESSESDEDGGSESETSDGDGENEEDNASDESHGNTESDNKSSTQSDSESSSEMSSYVTKSELSSSERSDNDVETKPAIESEITVNAEPPKHLCEKKNVKDSTRPHETVDIPQKPATQRVPSEKQKYSSVNREHSGNGSRQHYNSDGYKEKYVARSDDSRRNSRVDSSRRDYKRDRCDEYRSRPETSRDRSSNRNYRKDGRDSDWRVRGNREDKYQRRVGEFKSDYVSSSRDRNRNMNNKYNADVTARNHRGDRGGTGRTEVAKEIGKLKEGADTKVSSSQSTKTVNKTECSESTNDSSDDESAERRESGNSTGDEDSDTDTRGRRQTFERNTQDIELERRKRHQQEMEMERQKRREDSERKRMEKESRKDRTKQRGAEVMKNETSERNSKRSERQTPQFREQKFQKRVPQKWTGQKPVSRSRSRSPVVKSLLSIVTKDKPVTPVRTIEPLLDKSEVETLTRDRKTNSDKTAVKLQKKSEKAKIKKSKQQRTSFQDARELLRQKRKTSATSDNNIQLGSTDETLVSKVPSNKHISRVEPPPKDGVTKRKSVDISFDSVSPSKKQMDDKQIAGSTFKVTFNKEGERKSIHDRLGHHYHKPVMMVEKTFGRKPAPTLSCGNGESPNVPVVAVVDKSKPVLDLKPLLPSSAQSLVKHKEGQEVDIKLKPVTKTKPLIESKSLFGKAKHDKSKELVSSKVIDQKIDVLTLGDSRKIVTATSDARRVVRQTELVTSSQDTRHVVKVSSSCDSVLEKPTQATRKIKLIRRPPVVMKSLSDTSNA